MSTLVVPGQNQTCSIWTVASLALLQSLASGTPGNIACVRKPPKEETYSLSKKEETSILPSSLRRPPSFWKLAVSRRGASREEGVCSSHVSQMASGEMGAATRLPHVGIKKVHLCFFST